MNPLIGLGIGLVGGIGKMIGRGKANKDLKNLMKKDPKYVANPLAAQRLSYATALRDARMPGAAAAERNIMGAAGNAVSNFQRNATDSSQMLALAAGAQGQAQQGFENLATAEAQDQQRRMNNWEGAVQGQIGEEQSAFKDQVRRFENEAQIKGAMNENRASTWGDIAGLGFGLADFAQAGGGNMFKGLFGGGQQSPQQNTDYGAPSIGVDYNRLGKMLKR